MRLDDESGPFDLGLGLFALAVRRGSAWYSGYSSEAQQFFERITNPGQTRADLYAALIDALVADGVWSSLTALYVLAAADAATARTNLVSSSYGASLVGSPTFTADRGYAGNGSSSGLDTGINPQSASPFTQDSAHIGAWNLTSSAQGAKSLIGADSNDLTLIPRLDANGPLARINSSGGGVPGTSDLGSAGWFVGNRSSSSSVQIYVDGSLINTNASSSSITPPSATIHICRDHEFFAISDQIAAASVGASLDSTKQAAYYDALHVYLVAVGAV